jgi:hypothetical protein
MARIAMVPFRSTSVIAGGYDRRSATLRLRYVNGEVYDYHDVPSSVFDELLAAGSKGRFVNWHIKPFFDYEQVP